jgi:exoribonuclease II
MKSDVRSAEKYLSMLVAYLDQGRLRTGFVTREQERHLALIDADGRERLVARDLVLVRHTDRRADRAGAAEAIAALEAEHARLAADLDLELLWQVVHEQGRSFTAAELAELFFGRRSSADAAVMLEALLNDRVYFIRRHMDFSARDAAQVERLRIQQDRIRARSDDYRRIQHLIRELLDGGGAPQPGPESGALADELRRYLANPFTRSRDLTQMLMQAAPEVDPADAAFEILERMGARPSGPRFALIAGLKSEFSAAASAEAAAVVPGPRAASDGGFTITIDDDDTVEIDDALSIETLADGGVRVRIHIALVADFVRKGGAMDHDAAARATTVYLPETTIRMLPDDVSCRAASLLEGEERPVLTTDVRLSKSGELLDARIYPARVPILKRLGYDDATRMIADPSAAGDVAAGVKMLSAAAILLRQRRRTAGATLLQRREAKVSVHDDDVEIRVLDVSSPARTLVAEFMVLSNFVAARYATEHHIPIIYRVQPQSGGDFALQRPRLSLYPEFHSGIGLDYYAQLSSPIRRYADLVLQRQLVGALEKTEAQAYGVDELLEVLANAESAEASGRELERRAKRYWTLRYLERNALDTPLRAFAVREGATAELADYAVRGTLHGAPALPNDAPVLVRISRIDPLRGWLAFDFVGLEERAAEGAA